MSIVKKDLATAPQDPKISLEIDNGDLKALNDVVTKYNFVNEQAALRFAWFLLLNAENNNVYIDLTGEKKKVTPNEALLKPDVIE